MTREEQMYSAYQQLGTLTAVGERFGLTRERVRQLFKKHGYPQRDRKLSPDDAARIAELGKRHSLKEAAVIVGLNERTVRRIWREYGVTRLTRADLRAEELLRFVEDECRGNASEAGRRIGRSSQAVICAIRRKFPDWKPSGCLTNGSNDDAVLALVMTGDFWVDGSVLHKGDSPVYSNAVHHGNIHTSSTRVGYLVHHGSIPANHIIVPLDGNPLNVSKENLIARTVSDIVKEHWNARKQK